MRSCWRISVIALLVGASLHVAPTVDAAAAPQWDLVTGDTGSANSSGYKAVQVTADGTVYLAGWFQGTYRGLTSGAGYKLFVQRLEPNGSITWTTPVAGSDNATPLESDLVIDAFGYPYVRICPLQCRFAAYDPLTGNERAHYDSAGSNDGSWPIGSANGGVVIVDPQVGVPTAGAVRHLSPDLVEDWHYELTGEVSARGAVLVGALDGSIWVLGAHPSTPDHTVVVHLVGGSKVGAALDYAGFVPLSTSRAAVPRGASPVVAVAEDHMWISMDKAGPDYGPLLSLSTSDGQINGEVNMLAPFMEQVATSAGLAECEGTDLDSIFGTNGKQARFNPAVVASGTRIVTIVRCTAHSIGGDVPVSMLGVYATHAPLGGDLVRESVRFISPSARVEGVAANATGAVVLAGSTPGTDFLGPDSITSSAQSGNERAGVAQNPTGSLLPSRDFTSLAPIRLFDTRPTEGQGVVNVAQHRYGGTTELRVRVTSKGGVPTNGVGAVSLNLTVTNPAAAGFVTVYPCGDRPLASSLNYRAGQTVANAVVAPVSSTGEICLFSSADTHVIADVNGWLRSGGGFSSVPPKRLFDTRPSEPAGLRDVAKMRYGGATVLSVHVADVGGVPALGVAAVSLNVTVTDPTANGFVTVYPCGDRPLASNVNFVAGQTVANAVIAPLSPNGQVCFYSSVDTHLLADVNGWLGSGSAFHALSPVRMFDTRAPEAQGAVAIDKHRYGGAQELVLHITGAGGVPATGVSAVSLNVTATEPGGNGYVTVYPCGTRPLASSLNYTAGQTVPNAVITPVSATGDVCFYSLVDTELLADVNGWFGA